MKLILIISGIAIIFAMVIFSQRPGVVPFLPNDDASNPGRILQANTLDLGNQGLTSIPSYVFGYKNLEELNVSGNNITGAIQAEIRHLGNLRILDASNNLMTGVPAEIGQLEKLEVLDLSNNRLTGLPYELGNLGNLKILNVSGNQYSKQDLDYIRSKLPSTATIIAD